jgi:hypothetical protein
MFIAMMSFCRNASLFVSAHAATPREHKTQNERREQTERKAEGRGSTREWKQIVVGLTRRDHELEEARRRVRQVLVCNK